MIRDIYHLQMIAQLVEAMNDSLAKLEGYYGQKDIENFNKSKKALLAFQQQISEAIG